MRRSVPLLVAVLVLASVACSGDKDKAASKPAPSPKPGSISLPSQLLGLKVVSEDISGDLKKVKQVYFDQLALFSFRETDELLRATLQVARFGGEATPEDPAFRSRVVAQLGSRVSRQVKVGETTVYLTGANQQSIFVWFVGREFYALSVRSDYPFSRTLLRRLVERQTQAAGAKT